MKPQGSRVARCGISRKMMAEWGPMEAARRVDSKDLTMAISTPKA